MSEGEYAQLDKRRRARVLLSVLNTQGKAVTEMIEQTGTGIEVKVRFFPLGWFLFFFHPTIVVDDAEHERKWGTHFFKVEPGSHTVRIFIEKNERVPFWMPFGAFFDQTEDTVGDSSTEVTVQDGEIVRLRYYMPPLMSAQPAIVQK